jgi:hypothetical protein
VTSTTSRGTPSPINTISAWEASTWAPPLRKPYAVVRDDYKGGVS